MIRRVPPTLAVSILVTALVFTGVVAASPLYLVNAPFDPPDTTSIYEVDPTTGAMTLRAEIGTEFTPVLALAAADGHVLFASGTDNAGTRCAGLPDSCLLLRIVLDETSTTPESVEIVGPFRDGQQSVAGIVGMTFRSDGVLYATSQVDSGLFTIDPLTAAVTRIGTVSTEIHGGDITFDALDRLSLWTNADYSGLYRVDPANAAATLVHQEFGANQAGLAALGHGSVLYGASPFTDRLQQMDPETGPTGFSVELQLDGARFDLKRGDLDSPYCGGDADCDDASVCTVDRCTPGGCRHDPSSVDATCDGVDDDCDGSFDEDFAGVATTCGFGTCASTGATSCVNGQVVDSCAPATVTAPEVQETLYVGKTGAATTLSVPGDTQGVTLRAYRGFRAAGRPWSYNQTCLAQGVTGNAEDALVPLRGTVFYYLVSREGCSESILGRNSAGAAIPNGDPCPSVGADADGDGVPEAIDNCPGVGNANQSDADGDGFGDACES